MGRDDAGRSRERRRERSRSRDRAEDDGRGERRKKSTRSGTGLAEAEAPRESRKSSGKEIRKASGDGKSRRPLEKDERKEDRKDSQKEVKKAKEVHQREGSEREKTDKKEPTLKRATRDGSAKEKDAKARRREQSPRRDRREFPRKGREKEVRREPPHKDKAKGARRESPRKDKEKGVRRESPRKDSKKEKDERSHRRDDSHKDRAPRRESPRSDLERESPRKNGDERKQSRREVCTTADNDGASPSRASSCGGRSHSGSANGSPNRRRGENGSIRDAAASGFGEPTSAASIGAVGPATYGAASKNDGEADAAPLPEKVRGLLDNRDSLFQDVLKLKQSLEDVHEKPSQPATAPKPKPKEEQKETVLKMPSRLRDSLLHPSNESRLLARTGLAQAVTNQEGLVVLRAHSAQGLSKAISQLKRIAYHCQWGCNQAKVAALLADKPARPTSTMLVRLAATSSRLRSHEARLTQRSAKLRLGTQAGPGSLCIDGVPGLSRKHCTITLEPEKAACYVQDLSTNGTFLNGKRLPRPPYRNPQDARVRLFHGDELFFKLRSEEGEELGYLCNILELS